MAPDTPIDAPPMSAQADKVGTSYHANQGRAPKAQVGSGYWAFVLPRR